MCDLYSWEKKGFWFKENKLELKSTHTKQSDILLGTWSSCSCTPIPHWNPSQRRTCEKWCGILFWPNLDKYVELSWGQKTQSPLRWCNFWVERNRCTALGLCRPNKLQNLSILYQKRLMVRKLWVNASSLTPSTEIFDIPWCLLP